MNELSFIFDINMVVMGCQAFFDSIFKEMIT